MDFHDMNTWLGLAVLVGMIGMIIYIILDRREKGDMIERLIEALKEANANTKALDLLEPLAMKVVPAGLVVQVNKAADFLQTLTPDQVDMLIEQFRRFFNAVTDGKPNTPPDAPAA